MATGEPYLIEYEAVKDIPIKVDPICSRSPNIQEGVLREESALNLI